MLGRLQELAELQRLLRSNPVVALVGPRQIGKTTLARALASSSGLELRYFDLERSRDLARLRDAETALEPLRGLIVIDEVQRHPDLFTVLRPLADRPGTPARFLILGSAAPALLQQASESLAGRIAYFDLDGLGLDDVGVREWPRLWIRGGYPRAFLAASDDESHEWRSALIRSFLERDLPGLGIAAPAALMERFWTMLAHYHGQTWKGSEFARALALSEPTVRRHLDVLANTYMVRVLQPYSTYTTKRLVKAPKVYVRDTGLLHSLLELVTHDDVLSHPKVGASFEGFALGQVVRRLRATPRQCHFWATHQGAELDLLVIRGRKRLGFEFKHTVAPEVTRSMHIATEDLGLTSLDVVHVGKETYPLSKGVRAVSIERLVQDVAPL